MDIVNVNGTSLELDLMDADVMERYEAMNKKIPDQVQNINNMPGTTADKMRKICGMVRDYFDEIFGAGTAMQVFGNSQKLDIYLEAFGVVASASNSLSDKVKNLTEKYSASRVVRPMFGGTTQ